MVNGAYSDLENVGGPVLQRRSLRELYPDCPIPGEVVPPQAQFVSHRIATPLFGAGLIEAIPDNEILSRVGVHDPDGVHGVANIVFNPETGRSEIGRFGWKAQHSTIHLFAGDAYLNEIGITNTSYRSENLPQGQPIAAGWYSVADPEDVDDDVGEFTNFIRYLAAPARLVATKANAPSVRRGEDLFESLRCISCHTPVMQTGPNSVAALSNQPVHLYSDLLLHGMGSALADGIQQGMAKGDQFRTAPL